MSRVVLRTLAKFVALMSLLCGVGMAQTKPGSTSPTAVNVPPAEAPKVPLSVSPDTVGLAGVDPRTYVIGAEDILNVKVWREPDFSGAKGVRPDGKITMPLINDLQAEGLTPERLSAQLKQALSEFLTNPDVTVEVLQVNSKKYTITGGINRPGTYPLVFETRIADALANSGGFKDFANKKDILILRGSKRLHFNWNDYVKGKKLDQNILLINGDTLLVKD